MNPRSIIAILLLVVEAVAIYDAIQRGLGLALAVAVAVLVRSGRRKLEVAPDRYALWVVAIASTALLWWFVFPPRLDSGPLYFASLGGLFYVAVMYCAWHQVLQLCTVQRVGPIERPGPFPSFPCLGVFVLSVAGLFQFTQVGHNTYALTSAAYVALTVAYYFAHRDRWDFMRYTPAIKAVTVALLAVVLTLGTAFARTLSRNEQVINAWLNALTVVEPPPSAMGFSREGRLNNVTSRRTSGDQRAALWVTSESVPGYLRGLVFDSYRDDHWVLPPALKWLQAEPHDVPDSHLPDALFWLGPRTAPHSAETYQVLTAGSLLDTMFYPAGTVALAVETDSLVLDDTGTVRETVPVRGPGYTAVSAPPTPPAPLSPRDLRRYTEVPSHLDARVADLAAAVTGNAQTPLEKAREVRRYFIDNYQYKLGIQVPPGVDPLEYFLLEKPDAHCEFFASGAAIMLRLSGVPARYVTGFVAVERNEAGDFYIARNKDSHAWVEAWDPGMGWFIVEATPPDGVPRARDSSLFNGLRDSFALGWARLRNRFNPSQFDSIGEAVGAVARAMFGSVFGWLALLSAGAIALAFVVRRRFRGRRGPAEPDHVRRLHSLLERADAIASEAGLSRRRPESIRSFAQRLASHNQPGRIRQLAQWYLEYERVRYRDADNEGAQAFLEAALPTS